MAPLAKAKKEHVADESISTLTSIGEDHASNYEILQELSRGAAHCVVRLATRKKDKKLVALKFFG